MDAVWSIVLFFGALAFAGVLLGGSLWLEMRCDGLGVFATVVLPVGDYG